MAIIYCRLTALKSIPGCTLIDELVGAVVLIFIWPRDKEWWG